MKEHFLGERSASADDINATVTASLLGLSKDEYSAAIDRILHRWEKIVDIVGH
jgi:hypothetical protein